MLTRWSDLGRTLSSFAEMQRELSRLHEGSFWNSFSAPEWPPVDIFDSQEEVIVRAELPGVHEDHIELTINQDILTIAGHREVKAPEGYQAHRQERGSIRFSRSFSMPTEVDPEKVVAESKAGVLTVRLAKLPEAKPRKITIKAS